MLTLLTVLIALVCVMLMGIVLIQNPKGGGLDSTFGGAGGANQMLGAARTTDFVEKLTWGLAIALFVLCLLVSLLIGGGVAGGGPDTRTNESYNIDQSDQLEYFSEDTFIFEG